MMVLSARVQPKWKKDFRVRWRVPKLFWPTGEKCLKFEAQTEKNLKKKLW